MGRLVRGYVANWVAVHTDPLPAIGTPHLLGPLTFHGRPTSDLVGA